MMETVAPRDYPPRFLSKVAIRPGERSCRIWTGARIDGYGQFWHQGRVVAAHRFAHEWLHGPIPAGLELHHTCEIRACVNPAHLELVTHRENVTRRFRDRTTCAYGHAYAVHGFMTQRPGGGTNQRCRICVRELQQARRARKQRATLHEVGRRCECGCMQFLSPKSRLPYVFGHRQQWLLRA
jgi:hypothetical protein